MQWLDSLDHWNHMHWCVSKRKELGSDSHLGNCALVGWKSPNLELRPGRHPVADSVHSGDYVCMENPQLQLLDDDCTAKVLSIRLAYT